ncbi:hypothetical protein TELCIR_13191, partial [Teladorsagia circumcincta]
MRKRKRIAVGPRRSSDISGASKVLSPPFQGGLLTSDTVHWQEGSQVDYRFRRTHKTDGSALLKFTGERSTYDQKQFVNVPIKK